MNKEKLRKRLNNLAMSYDGSKESKPLLTLLEEENAKYDLSVQLTHEELTNMLLKPRTPFSKQTIETPHIKTLDKVIEKPTEWLITNYIPKNEITILCGDGGVGKGFISSAIVASISSGSQVFFESEEEYLKQNRKPQKVLFMSNEEDISKVTKRKILSQGNVIQENIIAFGAENKETSNYKFKSKELKNLIHNVKPQLIIFDPIQSFIEPNTNLSDKATVRDFMSTLKLICEEENTTIIILAHTNKREGCYGRNRMADSADIWDCARSVFIVGMVDDKTRYISHEKSNYSKQQPTTLFEIFDKQVIFKGITDKKDKEFVTANSSKSKGNPIDEIMLVIKQVLKESEKNQITNKELKEIIENNGYSSRTYERAKKQMKENNDITTKLTGKGKERQAVISLNK